MRFFIALFEKWCNITVAGMVPWSQKSPKYWRDDRNNVKSNEFIIFVGDKKL